ncbi:hypothetical protein LOTGIDRAFT_228209 [Lottia gigantea]|uniref:Uncharacterized protein n=1 Tax=Lottia gigantea TaxID=225164 RepID=V4AUR8_LOTGI|nr:hypothetical protein LOTGIDRAFT_228209 [Lottia gigantea]ESO97546.1 hypothetical protein LOTGIDRAFT_228209 [Lottia gigantea]
MCFLDTSETNGGRLATRNFHDWILPRNVVFGLCLVGIVFLFIGIILLAIGAASSGAVAAGAVFMGLGGCCLLIFLFLCLHAYCIWYVRDQETQTTETIPPSETIEIEPHGFITPEKPSSLRRNGKPGYKKVTMSPDIQVADKEFFVQDQPQRAVIQDIPAFPASPHIITYIPTGQRTSTPEKQQNIYNVRSPQPSQQPHQQLHQQPQPATITPGAYITQADKVDSLRQQYRSEASYPVKSPYSSLPSNSANQSQMFSHYSNPNPYDSSPKFPVEARYYSATLPNKTVSNLPGIQSHQRTSDASSYSYSSSGHTTQNQMGTGSYGQSTQLRGPIMDLSQTRLLGNEDYDNTVSSTSILSNSGDQKTWRQLPVHHMESDELPEPTPLQYPSAKRPMTFEQQSSSKMSIYENMLVE